MAQPISSARRFFERVTTAPDPAAFIRGLVNSDPPTYEGEWLDFKRTSGEDARIWSEALSGFANTEGGVLIWGVVAVKDKSGVDAANGFALVEKPSQLRSRLMELHHGATDPPVAGVEVVEFIADKDTGAGFVVCYVPESDYKPHRSELVKHKPYYMRAGESFVIPSPSLLRNWFYPKSSPQLMIGIKPGWHTGEAPGERWSFDVSIANRGTSTARDIYITIPIEPGTGVDRRPISTCSAAHGVARIRLLESLHPGMQEPLCRITIQPYEQAFDVHRISRPYPIPGSPIQLEFTIYCADNERRTVKRTFGMPEFLNPEEVFT